MKFLIIRFVPLSGDCFVGASTLLAMTYEIGVSYEHTT